MLTKVFIVERCKPIACDPTLRKRRVGKKFNFPCIIIIIIIWLVSRNCDLANQCTLFYSYFDFDYFDYFLALRNGVL